MDIEKICASLRVLPTTEELLTAEKALYALRAENEQLRAELEQVKRCIEIVENQRDQMKRERDAAVEDLHKLCPAWKWDGEEG